jgi:hypothetical protein
MCYQLRIHNGTNCSIDKQRMTFCINFQLIKKCYRLKICYVCLLINLDLFMINWTMRDWR